MFRARSSFALLALGLSAPRVAAAQALASPFGTVSQKIDSTTMTVEYYRPSARGRAVFGRVVRWDELWTPGANWATTLDVDHDVLIEGKALPKGKYSVWFIPAERPGAWTVVLNKAFRRFHVVRPDPSEDQLRLSIVPDSGSHIETLTFAFPEVSREGATLQMRWAAVVLPIHFLTGTSRSTVFASHPLASYAGVYSLRADFDPNLPAQRYEIVERDGGLWVRTTPEVVEPGLDQSFDLVPAGGDFFHPHQYKDGKLVGLEADERIEFKFNDGQLVGFEIRGLAEDRVLWRATRVTAP